MTIDELAVEADRLQLEGDKEERSMGRDLSIMILEGVLDAEVLMAHHQFSWNRALSGIGAAVAMGLDELERALLALIPIIQKASEVAVEFGESILSLRTDPPSWPRVMSLAVADRFERLAPCRRGWPHHARM